MRFSASPGRRAPRWPTTWCVPAAAGIFSGTRLTFNFAKGIKEPSIYYENNSLYQLLSDTALVPNGPQLIAQYHIQPFLAEHSRTYDGGVQQQLFGGKAALSAIYFHNEFTNQAEFVDSQYLVEIGVPRGSGPSARHLWSSGQYPELSRPGRRSGLPLSDEPPLKAARRLDLYRRGGTAVVFQQRAQPAINPLFPTIPIGAYSPLVGARPFRIAPNTGFAGVDWNAGRWFVSAMGTFVSRRDDSTFLTDTELREHAAAAQPQPRSWLSESRPLRQLPDQQAPCRLYLAAERFEPEYQEVYGYPALPFTIRGGIKFTFGGESWKLN